ncbi:MAG: diguanylate cyclase domain-containing protein, partial [Bradyrhizobium sp.]
FKTAAHPPGFLAAALRSYYTGQWTIILAHRLTGANGVFLGVMTRRIYPANYEHYFASVALGGGSAIAMFHRDGTLLARYPHVGGLIGKKFNQAPLLHAVLTRGGPQTLRTRSPVDGKDRLGSAAVSKHIPIMIVATRTVAAALADWQAQTRFLVFVAALSVLVIAVLLFLIIREINRESQDAQRRLEAERHTLDTALNNMTQGLVLYDASARVVTFNRRYIDLFNLSTDVVRPGCHFRDLMQHRKDTGSYDGDIRAFCDPIMRNIAQGKGSMTIMEVADGRSFQIINKPLAQGGWVATIEDITERRTLEVERDRNYTFLREIIDYLPAQVTVKDAKTRQYLLVNSVAEFQFCKPRDEIIGKTAFEMFGPEAAAIVTADDDKTLQAPGGLFLDEHPWDTLPLGLRYITSKRIGIGDSAGEARYIINVVEDVTERRLADEKIAHLAHYDALTDLPNRVLFREQIEHELKRAEQGRQFALLYIDIDEFKGINDSLGHHVGDKLLQTVAARIRACVTPGDLIARLGGDEFAVIRTEVASIDDVVDFFTRLHET